MMKVAIWGTGGTYSRFKYFLKDNIEIVAFIETVPANTLFENRMVVSPEELGTIEYDYIIIFSVYLDAILEKVRKYGISEDRLILFNQYNEYSSFKRDSLFHKKLKRMDKFKNKMKILITGLSYHNEGIMDNKFEYPTINMAMGSQDLFYDYEVAKYVMHNCKWEERGGGKILYCWNELL